MTAKTDKLPELWRWALNYDLDPVLNFVAQQRQSGKIVYPPAGSVFRAFELTSPECVKVVILGQDPYHEENQAMGMAFSVPDGVPLPPSLRNIYQELYNDLGIVPPPGGNLSRWAEQGVLLINAVMTVEAHKASSHAQKGWEDFTDAVIRYLNEQSDPKVFILWGAFAGAKRPMIDETRHLVIQSAHPSPLSAHRGFFGSRPFSRANAFLGENAIQW